MKSTGYDPYYRLAAALIASVIKAARKIEQPSNHETQLSALKAIAWLARPGAGDQWFDMAGFEHTALVEHLPLDRWIARGRELLASDAHLREAVTRAGPRAAEVEEVANAAERRLLSLSLETGQKHRRGPFRPRRASDEAETLVPDERTRRGDPQRIVPRGSRRPPGRSDRPRVL